MLTAQQVQQDLEKLRDIVIALKSPESDLATTTKVINGIELNVFAKVPDNLRGVYKLGLEAADKDFLVYEDERFTFAQSLHTAEAMSQVLLRRASKRVTGWLSARAITRNGVLPTWPSP